MTVAYELEYETYRPRLSSCPTCRRGPRVSPRVLRRRIVVGAVLALLLVLLALPIRALGGSTLAQAAPAQGQEYIVKAVTPWPPSPSRPTPATRRR